MSFGFSRILEIPHTLKLVIQSWMLAEESLQYDIRECYPDVDEEFITQMFHGKLAATLMYASQCKHIEEAFLADLSAAFPRYNREVRHIAQGLVAEVTLHKRTTEKITGGDIGFIIIRPQVVGYTRYLRISDYRRGILCQAKLKSASGKWGGFTNRQIKILPERLQYLALLLYGYEDENRRVLQPFRWQLCDSAHFSQVQDWLKRDSFLELVNSDNIIASLGYGNIGTDDEKIIDEVISPARNPSLVIRVTWPKDQRPGGPDSKVRIYTRQEDKTGTRVKVGL